MALSSPLSSAKTFRFGAYELDLEAQQLRKAGTLVRLQPHPFKVLAVLVRHAGQIITRDELQREVWGDQTFVDFEQGLNFCIRQIRVMLEDDAQTPRYVETIPRRGYRFIATVEELTTVSTDGSAAVTKTRVLGGKHRSQLAVANLGWANWEKIGAALVVVGLAAVIWRLTSRTHTPAETDTVVLADFLNTTGDPVFDQTLKQGLIVQLEQSPFLSILSDRRTQETLDMMAVPQGAHLTPEIARQVCLRSGSTTVVAGSIHTLGSRYVVGLEATSCQTGNSIDHEQVEVNQKEDVLQALGRTCGKLRRRLGESLTSIQQFDTPLEQATTPSLEALHTYSIGQVSMRNGDFPSAVPYFKQAIALDPNFAMAYAALGTSYNNAGETSLAVPNFKKAYERREHVSDRERFYIESRYFHFLTGELEQARKVYELWHREYPHDPTPVVDLSYIDGQLGQIEKALEWDHEALRLDPESSERYANLAYDYLNLGRLSEAQATAEQARAKNFDSPHLRIFLYSLAFMRNDRAGMAEQAAWCQGRPGIDHFMLHFQSKTAVYYGELGKARELSQRAIALAESAKDTDEAAVYQSDEAVWEALIGNEADARREAHSSLGRAKGQGVTIAAALALALGGQTGLAQALSDELDKQYPDDTIIHFYYLPIIRAQLALDHHNYPKAIELLGAATPYESGTVDFPFYAVYVKGNANLAAGRGGDAAVEFRKMLDHPGILLEDPIAALARLGIARAFALQKRNTAQARTFYQDFFLLWKNADPNIPLLKQAEAEYAKLR